jgi:very-short-patch-repair endonuclease
MGKYPKKDTLIALMNNKKDFLIARNEHWYRIPVEKAPKIITEEKAKYLAFYQTKSFGDIDWCIKWYTKIKNQVIVGRRDLFPGEPENPKTNRKYYKVILNDLQELKNPILSKTARRNPFISTTYDHLKRSDEFNDVFYESPLEEKLWFEMKREKILAERQYLIVNERRLYYLDFAIFTRSNKINIECDGNEFHMGSEAVEYDKERNNVLITLGWFPLRFTTNMILDNLPHCMAKIKDTINNNGGIQEAINPKSFSFFEKSNETQIKMF